MSFPFYYPAHFLAMGWYTRIFKRPPEIPYDLPFDEEPLGPEEGFISIGCAPPLPGRQMHDRLEMYSKPYLTQLGYDRNMAQCG